jgi:hypothetical protein
VVTVQPWATGDGGTLTAVRPGRTTLTLTYQRQRSDGGYFDVVNRFDELIRPVTTRVTVTVAGRRASRPRTHHHHPHAA